MCPRGNVGLLVLRVSVFSNVSDKMYVNYTEKWHTEKWILLHTCLACCVPQLTFSGRGANMSSPPRCRVVPVTCQQGLLDRERVCVCCALACARLGPPQWRGVVRWCVGALQGTVCCLSLPVTVCHCLSMISNVGPFVWIM